MAVLMPESLVARRARAVLRRGVERSAASHGDNAWWMGRPRRDAGTDSAAGIIFGVSAVCSSHLVSVYAGGAECVDPSDGEPFHGWSCDAVGALHESQRAPAQESQPRQAALLPYASPGKSRYHKVAGAPDQGVRELLRWMGSAWRHGKTTLWYAITWYDPVPKELKQNSESCVIF